MLQLRDTASKVFAFSEDFVASWVQDVSVPEFVLPFVNGSLQLQSKLGFVSLDHEMGQHTAKEGRSLLAGDVPDELIAVDWVSRAVSVDIECASVGSAQSLDNGQVRHAYPHKHLETHVDAAGLRPAVDADVSLAVEKTGGISVIKRDGHSLSLGWDDGEVGGNPMPGPKGCGRATPSQAGSHDRLLGVCNEQVPSAKAKACSELHGNMQKSAEMTGSVQRISSGDIYIERVTDCNTSYIKYRPAAKRNMVPLDAVASINQDASVKLIAWAGNMALSNAQLQGVLVA